MFLKEMDEVVHDRIPRQFFWISEEAFRFQNQNFLWQLNNYKVLRTVTILQYICKLQTVKWQPVNISRPNKIIRSSKGKEWHATAQQKLKNLPFLTTNEYPHSSITVCSTLWEVVMWFNTNVWCRIMAPTSVLFLNNFLFSAPFIPGTALTLSSSHFKLVWGKNLSITFYNEIKSDNTNMYILPIQPG